MIRSGTLAIAAIAIFATGCLRPAKQAALCAPDQIELGTLLRVDRTAEAERGIALADGIAALGAADPIAAIYEFAIVRDKPLFYFVAGRGRVDSRALVDEALHRFGGTTRRGVEPRARTVDGATFLCVPFDRGRGLVAISGVCAFADDSISGYAVRTDGGDDDDALKYGVEARRFHRSRADELDACPDRAALAARAAPPANRDDVAREVVAAIRGWKCARLAALLPTDGLSFLEERVTSDFRDPQHSALEQACFALGNLDYPLSETMAISVEWERDGRARLWCRGGWLDSPAPLQLVSEADAWRLDRDWTLRVTQDLWTRRALMSAASNVQSDVRAAKHSTHGRLEVTRRASIVADLAAGSAGADTPYDRVYVKITPDGETACVTARSRSEAILMVRVTGDGYSYGRFETPPAECPAKPLDGKWAG